MRTPERKPLPGRRAGVLAEPDFRRFYTGYVTSLLGSSMSAVAIHPGRHLDGENRAG